MIVLLTEEESMQVTLEILIRQHHPELIEGLHWWVLKFNGKSDLERNIPQKMRKWNLGDPLFVILRDNDGSDCKVLKERLANLASGTGKPFKIRVVCQELESWFIGDNQAVTKSYPGCRFSNDTAKYRNPDRMTNASQELADLTGDSSKVQRAAMIAPHLDPARNVSRSFQVLFETLQQHLG
jgi:hypothetical protein